MTKLSELAALIRSKNAGPFWLTYDIMFATPEAFERARDAPAFTRERLAERLSVEPAYCMVTVGEEALAIKVSVPRAVTSGAWGDADLVGGQQYAPLLDIEVP